MKNIIVSNANVLNFFDKSLPVVYTVRPEINREFLRFDLPNGSNDLNKISKKILSFKGKDFSFAGWNSEEMTCCFSRVMDA